MTFSEVVEREHISLEYRDIKVQVVSYARIKRGGNS